MQLRAMGVVVGVAAVVASGAFGVTGSDKITTIAGVGKFGTGGFSGDGGPATSAQLSQPHAVAVDAQGSVYIADSNNNRIRKVGLGGTISTLAGTGRASGFSGDGGPATSAYLSSPRGVAVDGQRNIYIADYGNNRVRKVSPGGTITTFAGTGIQGFSGDGGPATSAQLYQPHGVAVDAQGNVYIAEYRGNRVRKVSPGGTITTLAGTGKAGFSGDGGPATSARLYAPAGVAVDGNRNVYIADQQNGRVRKVSPGGTITTFAGTGVNGFSGEGGPATSAQLANAFGVAVDKEGNVYIADADPPRMLKVAGGKLTRIAGRDPRGPSGGLGEGGPATSAQLSAPFGVAVDGKGSVYIAEVGYNTVRKVWNGSAPATATYAGFYSPSRNLSCEMADRDARGSYVYCQSVKAPKNVRMSLDGRLKICRGIKCLGNPAENTPALGYGRKITIGRFACSSQKSGVKCTVTRSGKGFLISRTGVRRIGR